MIAYFTRLFTYDAWANREVVVACERASDALPPKALARLAHVAAAHRLWQARLRGEPAPVPVWPDWTLMEAAGQVNLAAEGWAAWLRTCTAEKLDRTIRYKNSKGEAHTSRVDDVLTHALMHAAYHRGQIAADLRAAGAEPPYTDFVHATRTGRLENFGGGI